MNANQNEKKTSPNRRVLKIGSLSVTTTAIVIAVFIVLNLFVGELPSTFTKYDMSKLELFTISDETRAVLDSVAEDVRFYILADRGSEDSTIREMLERYHALNPRVTYSIVDPVTNPGFIQKYTTDTLDPNSVICESDRRSYVIPYDEIYRVSYSEEEIYNYYYYGQIPSGTPYYYGELMFSTAADYVTRSSLPVLYTLTGHGETALSETYTGYIKDNNVGIEELTLLNIDAIPDDCASLLINAPSADISKEEEAMLEEYVSGGGDLILVTGALNYNAKSMPNLAALAASVGLESVDGVVFETDRRHYTMNPYYLLPNLGDTDAEPLSLMPSSEVYVLADVAHGILSDGTHNVRPLLYTSSEAYVKANINSTNMNREIGDVEGMVYVGASSETEGGGKFVWFSSEGVTGDTEDQYVSGGNSALFLSVVDWMNGNPVNLSILGKQMQVESLVVTEAQSMLWTTMTAIIIPLAFVALGFVIWFRRRRK